MSLETEQFRSGVAALQRGDRSEAIRLFTQVVDVNPLNEQAWFYLAAADTDPFMRKRYLERVLEINPANARARDVLSRIDKREQPNPVSAPTPAPVTPIQKMSALRTPEQPSPSLPTFQPTADEDAIAAAWDNIGLQSPPEPVVVPPPVAASPFTSPIDVEDELPDPSTFMPTGKAARSMDDLRSSMQPGKPTTLKVLAPDAGMFIGAAVGEDGFALPLDIPGSPARVSLASMAQGTLSLVRTSIRILTRRADVYLEEIPRATWWRFWLYTVSIGAISTLLLTGIVAVNESRMTAAIPDRVFNFFSPVLTLLLGVPFYALTLIGGCAISYLLCRQLSAARPPLLKHVYAVSMVWLPLSLVATIVAFVLTLGNVGGASILTTTLLAVYAALIQQQGIASLYPIEDTRRKQIAGASAMVSIFIMRLILGVVMAGLTGASVLVWMFS